MTDEPEPKVNLTEIEARLHNIQPVPGLRFYRRMAGAPWSPSRFQPEGVRPMNRNIRLGAFALAILIVAVALLVSPFGQAFASQLVQYFKLASGRTIPLPPEQIVPALPSETPQPTYALALQPAGQAPAPTYTPTPTLAVPSDPQALQDLSSVEAESYAGFELYEPAGLPKDYRLKRISYDNQQQAVTLMYASPQAGTGEFFQITQGRRLAEFSTGPGARVEPVMIGASPAELVRGDWFVANGASAAVWEGQAEIYTLRWQVDEIQLEAKFFLNESFSPAYLTREEMLAATAGLSRCQKDYACEIRQAAAAAGFAPWQFPERPDAFRFNRVYYQPGLTATWFDSGSGELGLLQSTRDFAAGEHSDWFGVPADAVQPVQVGGQPGEYVQGGFVVRPGETQAVWTEENPLKRLRWKNGEFYFQIVAWGEPDHSAHELAGLAGQLTAAAAMDAGRAQPGAAAAARQPDLFTGVAAVEAAAGFDLLEPALLPEGLAFSHARYTPAQGHVMLFYGSFAADKYQANGPLLLVIEMPAEKAVDDGYDQYPAHAIQAVQVNGYPGKFIRGSLMTGMAQPGQPTPVPTWDDRDGMVSLVWRTPELQIVLQFNSVGQAGRLGLEELLEIAAGLR